MQTEGAHRGSSQREQTEGADRGSTQTHIEGAHQMDICKQLYIYIHIICIYIYTYQVSNKTQTVIMRMKETHDKAAPNPYSNYSQVGLTT